MTISFGACSDASNTAANKPARKVYYAHDVQTGSHLQRAYTDPDDANSGTAGALTGSPDAGQQPFVGNTTRGNTRGSQ